MDPMGYKSLKMFLFKMVFSYLLWNANCRTKPSLATVRGVPHDNTCNTISAYRTVPELTSGNKFETRNRIQSICHILSWINSTSWGDQDAQDLRTSMENIKTSGTIAPDLSMFKPTPIVLWLSPTARVSVRPLQDCTNQQRQAPTGTDS